MGQKNKYSLTPKRPLEAVTPCRIQKVLYCVGSAALLQGVLGRIGLCICSVAGREQNNLYRKLSSSQAFSWSRIAVT